MEKSLLDEPLPFKNEIFNLIISSLTLHYIDDWVPTFREFYRIMKPGGQLLWTSNTLNGLITLLIVWPRAVMLKISMTV
ncbi:class I SAM-dependent methyltransferase [Bacillus sp. FJAT-28004]|uniref:class I SAM-dependent methyltransferase n=1 Tax=Bacillus sp. FJAT-28004 TaxID=1679165 RepID=UPI0006B45442|nr:methyltransferase domain-containing protein [Bacillus sp. FJAT-28004]